MISDDFLDQLNRFNLVVQKRVTSNYVGTRESVAMGHGLTFEDHQQYTPGDDYRRIDWKVYGRTDKLHVRRFEEERSLTVHILTDASASMKFKKKSVSNCCLSLLYSCTRRCSVITPPPSQC